MNTKKVDFFNTVQKAVEGEYKYLAILHEVNHRIVQCVIITDDFLNATKVYDELYDDEMKCIHCNEIVVTKIVYDNSFDGIEKKLGIKGE